MKRVAFVLLLGLAPMAQAQPASDPAIERVIVTAPRIHSGVTPGAIAHDFVKTFAVPSVLTEQISRWEVAVCPVFLGVAPQFAAVMEAHFRSIAGEAGAPMKDKGCKPNLLIFFTAQPQAQLDALHAKDFDALGYHANTTITYPVQAWYEAGIKDLYGNIFREQENYFEIDPFRVPPQVAQTSLTPGTNVGGWRYRADITNVLMFVTIIVDSVKTAHYTVGSIGDYIAMLALSRSEDYGDCQLMPSITNLLSPNCDDRLKPSQISPTDIAYLRGVYKMDPGAKLIIQQDQIAAEMAKAIPAKAGP